MFRLFQIGFSLYERAWTLRGMENLLKDFLINPGFIWLFKKLPKTKKKSLEQIEKELTS